MLQSPRCLHSPRTCATKSPTSPAQPLPAPTGSAGTTGPPKPQTAFLGYFSPSHSTAFALGWTKTVLRGERQQTAREETKASDAHPAQTSTCSSEKPGAGGWEQYTPIPEPPSCTNHSQGYQTHPNQQRTSPGEQQRVLLLPVFHPRLLHAGFAGGRRVLHRELPQAPGDHGHCPEFAARAEAGAAGILPVQPVLRAPALYAVLGAHKGDLHGAPRCGLEGSLPSRGLSRSSRARCGASGVRITGRASPRSTQIPEERAASRRRVLALSAAALLSKG